MSNKSIDHIAYAISNTDKSLEIFSILGFTESLFYKQKIEKFASYITKIQSAHGEIVELVEPITNKSVVTSLIKNKQSTIYHAAFYTNDLNYTLKLLKDTGAVIITEPMSIPYPATRKHSEYKTSHVFHPSVGIFEITGPNY